MPAVIHNVSTCVAVDNSRQTSKVQASPQPPRWLGARPRYGGAFALPACRLVDLPACGVDDRRRQLTLRKNVRSHLLEERRTTALESAAAFPWWVRVDVPEVESQFVANNLMGSSRSESLLITTIRVSVAPESVHEKECCEINVGTLLFDLGYFDRIWPVGHGICQRHAGGARQEMAEMDTDELIDF